MSDRFQLVAPFAPAGDQPQAIAKLVSGFESGVASQTLLGVTGSGKTYTIANVIQQIQRPTLVMAPNKTLVRSCTASSGVLSAQRGRVFRQLLRLLPARSLRSVLGHLLEKDASINEHIEQMRLSATKTLLSRRCTIVATSPPSTVSQARRLSADAPDPGPRRAHRPAQADPPPTNCNTRARHGVAARQLRVRGELIDVFPAESESEALRIELFDGDIENLSIFDPLTGEVLRKVPRFTVYPKTHYATTRAATLNAVETIKVELKERLEQLYAANKLLEAQRLQQRTQFDIERWPRSATARESRTIHASDRSSPGRTAADVVRLSACTKRCWSSTSRM